MEKPQSFRVGVLRIHNHMFKVGIDLIDKRNSTAGAVQVETDLQEELSVHLHFRKLMLLKTSGTHGVQFALTPFNGKCQNLEMSPSLFCASLYHFRDIKISNCFPSKVGQDHEIQFLQFHHSMANATIYKRLLTFLRKLLPFQRFKNFKFVTFKK